GRYARILSADARLSLRTNPAGADALAYRYSERDRVLSPVFERALGKTPIADAALPPGSYLIVFRRAGFRDVRYPALLRPGERHMAASHLYTEPELGDSIYIPGGTVPLGGDDQVFDPLPRREIFVPDFAISRFPVTFGEYLEFINEALRDDPAA